MLLALALAGGEHRIVWLHPSSCGNLNQMSDASEPTRWAHWDGVKRKKEYQSSFAHCTRHWGRVSIRGVLSLRPGATRHVLSSLVVTELVACSCGRDQRSQVLLLPLVPLRGVIRPLQVHVALRWRGLRRLRWLQLMLVLKQVHRQ